MDWRRQVGVNVRRLRKAAGLTQEALAHRAGLSWRYVSGIERGEENFTLEALIKLADALAAHPRSFFDG